MRVRSEETRRKDAIRKREWAKKNEALVRERMAAYYKANKEKILQRSAAWVEGNRDRFEKNQAAYRKRESAKRVSNATARKMEKLRATPAWANGFFISEAYDLARRRSKSTGFEWQVDHIVPLKSKRVCGLHVEHNLRVIPAAVNNAKGNRYWPDMP